MPEKKLTKIKEGAKIAGVCTGLAAYFNTNVMFIRALFVITGLMWGGIPVLVYIVLAILLPEHDPDAVDYEEVFDDTDKYTRPNTMKDEYDDSDRYERNDDRYERKD